MRVYTRGWDLTAEVPQQLILALQHTCIDINWSSSPLIFAAGRAQQTNLSYPTTLAYPWYNLLGCRKSTREYTGERGPAAEMLDSLFNLPPGWAPSPPNGASS